jgi:N-acetylmuramoyl-L-alanine amidase
MVSGNSVLSHKQIFLLLSLFAFGSLQAAENSRSRWTVVLDAGHGGSDTGIVKNGLIEKQLTLEIANRTATQLTDAGCHVALTRDGDFNSSFDERRTAANLMKRGVFVSLHFGASPNSKLNSTRIYMLFPPSERHPKGFVALENAHAASMKETRRLAGIFQRDLAPLTSNSAAQMAPLDLAVLLGILLPAVLVELDDLTAENASRWNDPAALDRAALLLSHSIQRFAPCSP